MLISRQIHIQPAAAVATVNYIPTRSFSSSSSSTKVDVTQDDLNKARFVRFFAAIFMLTAGIRIAPNAAASTVDHTVKLLDAEERMLVSAGLNRLNMLLSMDAVKRRAVECGALPRLLSLIDSALIVRENILQDDNRLNDGGIELASTAVSALVAVSEVPEGLAAIKDNPASSMVLKQFVDIVPRLGGTEDALHGANRLLALIDQSS